MKHVRLVVQECKPGTVELLTRMAERTLVPRLRSMPGFISYEVAKVDDRLILVVSAFETRAGAEEMERIGAEWRKEYGKDAIVSVKHYIGDIILDARSEPAEIHPAI